MLEQKIRFCTAPDGTRLAYASVGHGPPILKAPNWLSHLEFEWESPVWKHWLETLSAGRRLVRYDQRGCGMSDWAVEDLSLDASVGDLETVAAAAGIERGILLGVSGGGPVAITYAVRHPERVSRLVLYGSYTRGWARRGTSPEALSEMEALLTLTKIGWGRDEPTYRQLFTSRFVPGATAEHETWFNEMQRISASPENAARLARASGERDVTGLLPRVSVPTLVLHARDDRVVPFREGQALAASIPGARFVPLDSGNHILLADEAAWSDFVDELGAFLDRGDDRPGATERAEEGVRTPAASRVAASPRRERIEALFEAALERDDAERTEWLTRACSGDAPLLAEVEALLDAHERGGGILSRSPGEVAAEAARVVSGPDQDPHEALHAALGERYELEGVVGEGGMGTVFLARDRKHGRHVAIKTLHPDLTTGLGPQRFEREIRLTAGLQHPHILPLLDSGVAGPFLYYIMPYVPGESLLSRMEAGEALDVETLVRIGRDVLEGLEYAHRCGVVHRDIKPGNILLGEDHALITDFGIAKAIADAEAGETLTRSGHAIGTPAYMAPEQFLGEATPRSDLYALGAVMYEALAGRRWKVGTDPERGDWKGVPAVVRRALRKALSLEPGRRWSDAGTFRRALAPAGLPRWRLLAVAAAAAALLLLVGILAYPGRRPSTPPPAGAGDAHASIAVLPFANRGGEETAIFVAGIHDDILVQLSKIEDLRLISRTSVQRYRYTQLSVGQIADELGVSTVLEGSVQHAGDRVKINVQLIEAETDDHVWAETYDERLTAANIFGIQSDVARKIAAALDATLTADEVRRIDDRPTESLEAYDRYVRGRYVYDLRGRSREGLEEARDLFAQAIEADSSYALPWAMLGRVYVNQWNLALVTAEEALPAAWAAVDRALELDPSLSEAHSSRAGLLQVELRYEEAEASMVRALALNPGSADEHRRYSRLLIVLERTDEAVHEGRRAVELDPLSTLNRQTLADALFAAGDWEGVVSESLDLLAMEPDNHYAYYNAGYGYALLGEHRKAIEALGKARALNPQDPYTTAALAWAHAYGGDREEALAVLSQVPEQGAMLKEMAIVYATLGDLDRAFAYLDRVAEEDPGALGQLKADQTARPLLADPRLEELLERVGLE